MRGESGRGIEGEQEGWGEIVDRQMRTIEGIKVSVGRGVSVF